MNPVNFLIHSIKAIFLMKWKQAYNSPLGIFKYQILMLLTLLYIVFITGNVEVLYATSFIQSLIIPNDINLKNVEIVILSQEEMNRS